MEKLDELIKIFSKDIRMILRQISVDFDQVQEIRLRVHAPLLIIFKNQEYYVTNQGNLSRRSGEGYQVTRQDLKETLEYISSYSLYAFEEEIKQGFITIQGGHRIGIAGKIITDSQGIRGMKFISFMNVRLSHQVPGCASKVMPYLYENRRILHCLIVSPPRCGKTTLLRDIIRQVSNGTGPEPGMTVGVVDERSEIAACYQGVPQNDVGIRTDVLDCCPKALGLMMMIRTMAPQVIAVDEVGSREELEAMEYAMNCGCRLIATVHGSSIEDIRQKPVLQRLIRERWFERYIILGSRQGPGSIEKIFDAYGSCLYPAGGAYEP